MERKSTPKFQEVLENIMLSFDFLLKRGFRISTVLFASELNGNWRVSLMAKERLVEIYTEEGQVYVALGILQINNEVELFDLEALVHFVTGGRHLSYWFAKPGSDDATQIKQSAQILEKHLEAIWAKVEKESLLILKHPAPNSERQQKRTII